MIIEKLNIYNYRGFRGGHTLNFNKQLNVFIGINGAGKSSLLDLIAVFLNRFTAEFAGSEREIEYSLNQMDINIHEKETVNSINVLTPRISDNKKTDVKLSWGIIKDFNKGTIQYNIPEYIDEYQNKLIKNVDISIPIFKYFQSQRITNEKHKHSSAKRYISEQLKAYDDAFDKSMEFDEFVKWFIEEENIENREKIARKDFNYSNSNLNAIRDAIKSFFSKFKADKYDNFRVEDRTIQTRLSEKSSLVINKNGNTFNLKQLSDGEKITILMISDIAHRLAIANPNSKNILELE